MPRKKCKQPKWVRIAERKKPLAVMDTFPVHVMSPMSAEQAWFAAETADYLSLMALVERQKHEREQREETERKLLVSELLWYQSSLSYTVHEQPIVLRADLLQHFVEVKHRMTFEPPNNFTLLYSALRGTCMLLIYSKGKNWLCWLSLDHFAYHAALPPPGAYMQRPCYCSGLPWDDSLHQVAAKILPSVYLTHIAAALPAWPLDLCKLVIGLESRPFLSTKQAC
jgi:hypothetical protein